MHNYDLNSLILFWIVFMTIVVFTCFFVSEITRNYSQVDKLWSLIPIAYSWITFSFSPSSRVLLMSLLVTAWGLRLSYNFYRKGGYNIIPWKGEEDYRWKIIREKPVLQGRLRFGLFNFFFISLYQNVVIFLFSSPLLLSALNPSKPLTSLDLIAALLMVTFILTEAIADNQLFEFHRIKKEKVNTQGMYTKSINKGFMTEGLWKYSRHPNFASEQAIWICFYLFGVAASGKWLNITIAGPVLLVLLFAGSSELTENISGKKYPDYKLYRKEVSRFIPFFKTWQNRKSL